MSETLLRRWLKTDAGRAAVAQVYFDGVNQKRIAFMFGYSNRTAISREISIFLAKYAPESAKAELLTGLHYGGEARRAFVPVAIERYLAARSQAPA